MRSLIHGSARFRRLAVSLTLALPAALGLYEVALGSARQERARVIPAPSADEAPTQVKSETAILAGGCFWGVQAVFQHVKGVSRAVSGYAGGQKSTANYETVGRGTSGHAESVQVVFDPRQISYGKVLQIFFSVAHDPTQLNRQGPDFGPQYRSTIFPATAEQERVARAYIAQLNDARAFDAPIVTTIESERRFYDAEEYHQDFLVRNPSHPYIVVNDLPKIDELKRVFPGQYRATPVLVGWAR
jgi:peptide-methionine (S)-S-oxide reductase